jgi:hypothetical protein
MRQGNGIHRGDRQKQPGLKRNGTRIRAEHRRRLAVVYVRRSTVGAPSESTESQLALVELPRRLGWPASAITILEDDLGVAGISSNQRPGFQRLLEMMGRDEVGIVLVSDVTRLSRHAADRDLFVEKALRYSVLLGVNGKVYDLSAGDAPTRTILGLSEFPAGHERLGRERMHQHARRSSTWTRRGGGR